MLSSPAPQRAQPGVRQAVPLHVRHQVMAQARVEHQVNGRGTRYAMAREEVAVRHLLLHMDAQVLSAGDHADQGELRGEHVQLRGQQLHEAGAQQLLRGGAQGERALPTQFRSRTQPHVQPIRCAAQRPHFHTVAEAGRLHPARIPTASTIIRPATAAAPGGAEVQHGHPDTVLRRERKSGDRGIRVHLGTLHPEGPAPCQPTRVHEMEHGPRTTDHQHKGHDPCPQTDGPLFTRPAHG